MVIYKQNTAISWVYVQAPLVAVHTLTLSTMTALYISIYSYYYNEQKLSLHINTVCLTRQQNGQTQLQQHSSYPHNDSTVHVAFLRVLSNIPCRRLVSNASAVDDANCLFTTPSIPSDPPMPNVSRLTLYVLFTDNNNNNNNSQTISNAP